MSYVVEDDCAVSLWFELILCEFLLNSASNSQVIEFSSQNGNIMVINDHQTYVFLCEIVLV